LREGAVGRQRPVTCRLLVLQRSNPILSVAAQYSEVIHQTFNKFLTNCMGWVLRANPACPPE
jgi:hypothetical protein